MNERIIELANKANEDIGYTFKLEDANQIHTLMEKFAMLIAKECAKVARNTDLEDVEGGDGAVLRAASQAIENHFGVK